MQSYPHHVSSLRAHYIALVQTLVDEPVLAAGVLTVADAMRETLLGETLRGEALLGETPRRETLRVDAPLPSSVLAGVTTTNLHCFSYGLRGRELWPRAEVARLTRSGLRAEFSTTRMTKRIVVSLADGRTLQFESMRGFDINDELFRHLLGGLG